MSFGLGMLRFVEEEVGVRAQCVESVGNESYFPYMGYNTVKFGLQQREALQFS